MELSIGQVSKQLGVSKTSLRNWADQGLIPKPKRKQLTKARFWTEQEVGQIKAYIEENY